MRLLEFGSLWAVDRIVTYTELMAEELELGRFQEKLYPHGRRYIALDEKFTPQIPIENRDQWVG